MFEVAKGPAVFLPHARLSRYESHGPGQSGLERLNFGSDRGRRKYPQKIIHATHTHSVPQVCPQRSTGSPPTSSIAGGCRHPAARAPAGRCRGFLRWRTLSGAIGWDARASSLPVAGKRRQNRPEPRLTTIWLSRIADGEQGEQIESCRTPKSARRSSREYLVSCWDGAHFSRYSPRTCGDLALGNRRRSRPAPGATSSVSIFRWSVSSFP
jgi:hypothetical protein